MSPSNIAHCTFLVARKDSMSYEEFESEYLKHIPKAVPVLKEYGATYSNGVRLHSPSHSPILFHNLLSLTWILKQFNSPALRAASIAALGLDEETVDRIIQDHDAIATIKFPDMAALKAFMESKENREQLAPDGPRYTSEVRQRLSVGTEWLGIEGGESLL